MNSVTLAELKTTIKDGADMSNSSFLDDTQILYWINSALSELHDLLVTSFEDYFIKIWEFPLDGSEKYILPDDFYKSSKVFYKSGNNRYRIRRFMPSEFDLYSNTCLANSVNMRNTTYRIMGNSLWFAPTANLSGDIEIWYISQFKKLKSPDDEVQFSVPVMWEDFVVSDVCARALAKEESDPSYWLARKMEIKQRILEAAAERDTGEAGRIVDIYRWRSYDDYLFTC
jgi:hypothetical protein